MEPIEVYTAFRKAQSNFYSRPYRIPKDFEYYVNTKLSPSNRQNLQRAADYFATKWSNIDIDRYMLYGFELFGKRFSYHLFFDKRLINLYIQKDKNDKREVKVSKRSIINSAKYVKNFFKDIKRIPDEDILREYGKMRVGYELLPVAHYIKGKIDKYFFVWLIDTGYISLNDSDMLQIPYITENYRTYLTSVRKINSFMERVRTSLLKRDDVI